MVWVFLSKERNGQLIRDQMKVETKWAQQRLTIPLHHTTLQHLKSNSQHADNVKHTKMTWRWISPYDVEQRNNTNSYLAASIPSMTRSGFKRTAAATQNPLDKQPNKQLWCLLPSCTEAKSENISSCLSVPWKTLQLRHCVCTCSNSYRVLLLVTGRHTQSQTSLSVCGLLTHVEHSHTHFAVAYLC